MFGKDIGQHGNNFPEKQGPPAHKANGPAADSSSHFVKKSQHVGRGHQDSSTRMAHPQSYEPPNDESGEGQDGVGNSAGAGLGPEFN